jgi:hypothetical protein
MSNEKEEVTPTIIEALKQQSNLIDELVSRIDDLETDVINLQDELADMKLKKQLGWD